MGTSGDLIMDFATPRMAGLITIVKAPDDEFFNFLKAT
jgi:hypothetical protein